MLKTSKEMKIKTDIYRDLNFRADYQKFASTIQQSIDKASLNGNYQTTIVLINIPKEIFWYIDTELKLKKYNVASVWGLYKSYFILNWYNDYMEEDK